jgi:hypothetical protein
MLVDVVFKMGGGFKNLYYCRVITISIFHKKEKTNNKKLHYYQIEKNSTQDKE